MESFKFKEKRLIHRSLVDPWLFFSTSADLLPFGCLDFKQVIK